MDTQHLVPVMFEAASSVFEWEEMLVSSSGRLTLEGQHCLSTDSSGTLRAASAVTMAWGWHLLIGIYWYNSLKRSLSETTPSLCWNVSQAGNITSSASLDPTTAGEQSRADGTLQNGWNSVVRRRKLPLHYTLFSQHSLGFLFFLP